MPFILYSTNIHDREEEEIFKDQESMIAWCHDYEVNYTRAKWFQTSPDPYNPGKLEYEESDISQDEIQELLEEHVRDLNAWKEHRKEINNYFMGAR